MAELTLTSDAHEKRFDVRAGDTIVIRLPEQSGGGYRWQTATIDRARVSITSEGHAPSSTSVGASGISTFTLSARRAGTARVELKEVRPFEPDSIRSRFVVELHIIDEP